VQALGDQFLAAAGFALDQDGKRGIGIELDLVAQSID